MKNLSDYALEVPLANIDFNVEVNYYNKYFSFYLGDNSIKLNNMSVYKHVGDTTLTLFGQLVNADNKEIRLTLSCGGAYATIWSILNGFRDGDFLFETEVCLTQYRDIFFIVPPSECYIERCISSMGGITFHEFSYSEVFKDTIHSFSKEDHSQFIRFTMEDYISEIDPVITVDGFDCRIVFGNDTIVKNIVGVNKPNAYSFISNNNLGNHHGLLTNGRALQATLDYYQKLSFNKFDDNRQAAFAGALEENLRQECIKNGAWKKPEMLGTTEMEKTYYNLVSDLFDQFTKNDEIML